MTAFGWLLALTIRATLVLLVALALSALGRRAALGRHRLLTLTAFGLLLLPVLPALLPRWELALVPSWSGTSRTRSETPRAALAPERGTQGVEGVGPHDVGAVAVNGAARPRTSATTSLEGRFGTIAVATWLVGVVLSLVGLARALRREGRLLAASRPLAGDWPESLPGPTLARSPYAETCGC